MSLSFAISTSSYTSDVWRSHSHWDPENKALWERWWTDSDKKPHHRVLPIPETPALEGLLLDSVLFNKNNLSSNSIRLGNHKAHGPNLAPIYVKFYWNRARPVDLSIFYGCFMLQLQSWVVTDGTACITVRLFTKKSANPGLIPHRQVYVPCTQFNWNWNTASHGKLPVREKEKVLAFPV